MREKKIARYWSDHNESSAFSPAVYWLAIPILNRRYQQQAVAGEPYAHWLDYCVERFIGEKRPLERMLSIGCGTGSLERHINRLNAFEHMDAIDIAPDSIERARELATAEGVEGIHYFCHNIETSGFPGTAYDAVFYNSSLHHLFDIDQALQKTARALKEDGLLFVSEYIGPNRFDFTKREKEILRAVFHLIPTQYRTSLDAKTKGTLLQDIQLPDPSAVARADPSESVCSADIVPAIHRHFDVLVFNPMGGALFQFLLNNIAGHFHEGDPTSMAILEMLIQIEDTLMETGELSPHFAQIVARPKAKYKTG